VRRQRLSLFATNPNVGAGGHRVGERRGASRLAVSRRAVSVARRCLRVISAGSEGRPRRWDAIAGDQALAIDRASRYAVVPGRASRSLPGDERTPNLLHGAQKVCPAATPFVVQKCCTK
jgi:hypothetical protein